jgi:hypothetical protein
MITVLYCSTVDENNFNEMESTTDILRLRRRFFYSFFFLFFFVESEVERAPDTVASSTHHITTKLANNNFKLKTQKNAQVLLGKSHILFV